MEDERLSAITSEKESAIANSNNTYNSLLNDNESLYNQQMDYATQYNTTQNEMLDKQLAYQEEQIEQQKQTARENMTTESNKAKNDYLSYINPYGVTAETQASNGLLNTGLSETSKLGSYNTYQNRLASANKVMQDAITQYDNDINEARLNNDVQKAQNALDTLQMQLEYSESYYTNKSTITQNQLSNNQSLDSEYYNRYQTEYQNIQNEQATAEAIRQWEAEMAFQEEQARIAQEQWEKEYELSKYNTYNSSSSSSSSSSGSTSSGSSGVSLTDTTSSGTTYEAVRTPILDNKSYDWYNQNFSSALTIDQLNEKIATGIANGYLTESDADKIYSAFQLS